MEITLEEIQKKFESLPEDIRWAIMAANIDEHLIDIGHGAGLNVVQMGQLSLETHMVVFGFTPPENFEKSLQGSLGLPNEKIKALVSEINEKILKKIRAELVTKTGQPVEKGPEMPMSQINQEEQGVLSRAGIKIIPPDLSRMEIAAPNEIQIAPQGNETSVLGKAGIKIEGTNLDTLEANSIKAMEGQYAQPQKTAPILAQKLSNPFKMGATNTEYTVNNMSKDKPATPTTTAPKSYPPKADPYRLPPE